MTTVLILLAIALLCGYIALGIKNPEGTYTARLAALGLIGVIGVFASFNASASEYYYLPNPQLTPGASASVNTQEVCNPAYPAKSRNVTESTKKKVYARYGVTKANCTKGCKIDHLIPIAIGGANDMTNLWPHEYGADWTVYEKTRLEVRLRKAVCKEAMPIVQAQQCIASNWTTCYEGFYPGEHAKRVQK